MANRKNHTFDQLVAEGNLSAHSHIHKFGAVPAMSGAKTGTIWDVNDVKYPWSAFATAGVLTVDRAVGDAAKVITIEGLDANWLPISESIILTLATGNTGVKTFKRVYRAYVTSGVANVDDIDIKRGGVIVARITAELAQTLMMAYTVPAGKTGYLYTISCTAEAGADGTGNLMIRQGEGGTLRVGHSFEVTGGGPYDYEFKVPTRIVEKSDIEVWLTTRANNGRYTSAFCLLLIDND